MKILFGELIGVFESQSGYRVTVVHVIREGKLVWSGPKVIVMVSFGKKNLMQHVLFEVHDVAKQCVVVVLDELSCRKERGRDSWEGKGDAKYFCRTFYETSADSDELDI